MIMSILLLQIRATNFSSNGFLPIEGSFCANNISFHQLDLTINPVSLTVVVDSVPMTINYNTTTDMTSYIGGVPGNCNIFQFCLCGTHVLKKVNFHSLFVIKL